MKDSKEKQTTIKAHLVILLAAVLWGTTGTAQAFSPEGANPLVVGALRMAIGGTLLFIPAMLQGGWKQMGAINKGDLLLAAACVALYQPTFFMGVSRTGVALGTVLAIGSAPVFSGIIEALQGQRPTLQWVVATCIAISGCVLLFTGQGMLVFDAFGALMALGAGFSYALYVTASQRLFQQAPRVQVNGLIFFTGAVMLSPLLFLYDLSWLATARGALSILHLGIFTMALAYSLFSYGLVQVSVSKAVTLTLGEPLTAALLGMLVLKEQVTALSLVGICLIFLGLVMNVRSKPSE